MTLMYHKHSQIQYNVDISLFSERKRKYFLLCLKQTLSELLNHNLVCYNSDYKILGIYFLLLQVWKL